MNTVYILPHELIKIYEKAAEDVRTGRKNMDDLIIIQSSHYLCPAKLSAQYHEICSLEKQSSQTDMCTTCFRIRCELRKADKNKRGVYIGSKQIGDLEGDYVPPNSYKYTSSSSSSVQTRSQSNNQLVPYSQVKIEEIAEVEVKEETSYEGTYAEMETD